MAGTTAVGSSTSSQPVSASEDAFASMGSDTFLKLLVAQMKYQNPMSPSDPTAMLAQIAQYAQVEALNKLQTLQASGNALAESQQATDLIGQTVTATDTQGDITGKVTAARFTDAGPILVLDTGAEISLAAVARIAATATAAATPAATTPAATTPAATTPAATTPAATTPTTTPTTTPAATSPTTTDTTTEAAAAAATA